MTYEHAIIGSGFSGFCAASLLQGRSKACVISPRTRSFVKDDHLRQPSLEFNRPLNYPYRSYTRSQWNIGANRLVDRLSLAGNSGLWGGTVDLGKNCASFAKLSGIHIQNMNESLPGLRSNRDLGVLTDRAGKLFDTSEFFSSYRDLIDGYVEKIELTASGALRLIVQDGGEGATITAKNVIICTSVPQLIQLLISSSFTPPDFRFSLHDYVMQFKLHQAGPAPQGCTVSYKFLVALSRAFGLRTLRFPGFGLGPDFIDQCFGDVSEKMEFAVTGGDVPAIRTLDPASTFGKSIHYYGLRVQDREINSFLASVSPRIRNVGHGSIFPDASGPLTNYLLQSAMDAV